MDSKEIKKLVDENFSQDQISRLLVRLHDNVYPNRELRTLHGKNGIYALVSTDYDNSVVIWDNKEKKDNFDSITAISFNPKDKELEGKQDSWKGDSNPKNHVNHDANNIKYMPNYSSIEQARRTPIYRFEEKLQNKEGSKLNFQRLIQLDLCYQASNKSDDVLLREDNVTCLSTIKKGLDESHYIFLDWGDRKKLWDDMDKIPQFDVSEFCELLKEKVLSDKDEVYMFKLSKKGQPLHSNARGLRKTDFTSVSTDDLKKIFGKYYR